MVDIERLTVHFVCQEGVRVSCDINGQASKIRFVVPPWLRAARISAFEKYFDSARLYARFFEHFD